MFRKLMSIGFALVIVCCSIGVQVMEHHCIWCGGDRIEFIQHPAEGSTGDCCSATDENEHHGCDAQGCCESRLLKLTTGIISDEEQCVDLPSARAAFSDAGIPIETWQILNQPWLIKFYPDRQAGPPTRLSPGFLQPLRC